MSDEIDRAQERQEAILAAQIAAARRPATAPPAAGRCLNCDTRLRKGLRFCDADCRDDYQRRYLAQGINGRNPKA